MLAVEDNENFDDKLQVYRQCDNNMFVHILSYT